MANSNALPDAIFVTATNTHPLAAEPHDLVKGRNDDIKSGLKKYKSYLENKEKADDDISKGFYLGED